MSSHCFCSVIDRDPQCCRAEKIHALRPLLAFDYAEGCFDFQALAVAFLVEVRPHATSVGCAWQPGHRLAALGRDDRLDVVTLARVAMVGFTVPRAIFPKSIHYVRSSCQAIPRPLDKRTLAERMYAEWRTGQLTFTRQ